MAFNWITHRPTAKVCHRRAKVLLVNLKRFKMIIILPIFLGQIFSWQICQIKVCTWPIYSLSQYFRPFESTTFWLILKDSNYLPSSPGTRPCKGEWAGPGAGWCAAPHFAQQSNDFRPAKSICLFVYLCLCICVFMYFCICICFLFICLFLLCICEAAHLTVHKCGKL